VSHVSPEELAKLRTGGAPIGYEASKDTIERLVDALDAITADRDEAREKLRVASYEPERIALLVSQAIGAHMEPPDSSGCESGDDAEVLAAQVDLAIVLVTHRAEDAEADRGEARQEVAALRAQRDEISEVHRVETAALAARLEAAERERGELRAEVVTLRADLEEWRRSHREAESLADQAKRRRERTLETVEARADAAEAKLAAIDAPFHGGALHHIEMLHADQRESRDREEALVLKLDAAEAKLAALVEACERASAAEYAAAARQGSCRGCYQSYDHAPGCYVAAIEAALRAARGEL